MNGSVQCGIGCAYTDVAPNFSSSLNTIGNTLGAVAGIVGPLVVAFLTEELPFLWGWKLTFFLTGLMSTVALILWSVFMTAEIIPILNTPLPKRF